VPGRDQLVDRSVSALHDIPGLSIRILLDHQQITSGEWTTGLLQSAAGLQAASSPAACISSMPWSERAAIARDAGTDGGDCIEDSTPSESIVNGGVGG
jgi:hypothetical protein